MMVRFFWSTAQRKMYSKTRRNTQVRQSLQSVTRFSPLPFSGSGEQFTLSPRESGRLDDWSLMILLFWQDQNLPKGVFQEHAHTHTHTHAQIYIYTSAANGKMKRGRQKDLGFCLQSVSITKQACFWVMFSILPVTKKIPLWCRKMW